MNKAVIIDDEPDAVELLSSLLAEHCPEISVTGTAGSVVEGVGIIRKTRPDIVFLDIEMPHGSGFDLLERLPDMSFRVIFVTAYNQYAIKAIRVSALDYLLKPVDVEELRDAVQKAVRSIRDNETDTGSVKIFLENLKAGSLKKIVVSASEGFEYLDISEIVHIEGDRGYSTVHLKGGRKIVVCRNLLEFEKILDLSDFYRIHKSNLINLGYVEKYLRTEGGYVQMKTGDRIPVSRKRKDDFLQTMERFIGKSA
ncbi:MAG: LytTR family DNA-binding domain-containing protein [Bacteroidetes bacterium]|nr:LytTR family DNA-binding domain-containing protein [Bacteroidota bacterium]